MDTEAPNKFSQPFKEMADRIEKNDPKEFAGALLIVPPEGDPIAVMLTDPKQDLDAFWGMCAAKIQIAEKEQMMKAQGSTGGWPGGRR